jgi:hypothetical protein
MKTGAMAVLAAMCLGLAPDSARADPCPGGGDGCDAAETFEAATAIRARGWYSGDFKFESPADVDYYQFSVRAGQAIEVECGQIVVVAVGYTLAPCVATLFDPQGLIAEPIPPSGDVSRWTHENAAAGRWRLRIDGAGYAWGPGSNPQYYFGVRTSSGGASTEVDELPVGAGAPAPTLWALLGLLALLRRRLGASTGVE